MEASAKKEHKKFKDVKEALDGKSAKDPGYSLGDWFNNEWVQTGGKYDGKPCAKQPGQTTKPYCRDPDDRAELTKDQRNKRAEKKRKEDPNPNRSGEAKVVTQESAGEKDACYKKVKSRYKIWPSAYGSGALVKCRKVGASNWGTKSEEIMHEEQRYCPLCDKRETRSECSYGERAWDKVSVKDHEYSIVRSELDTLVNAAQRIKKKVGKGEGNLEAWVQSKITKATDYIDTAADYIDSGEMKESQALGFEIKPSRGAGALTPLPKIKEEKLVNKILDELQEKIPCWKGYKRKKDTQEFSKGSCVKSESVNIEDANGNTFVEIIDLIQPKPIKGFKSQIKEASTRLQAETGNIIAVILSWRGKSYSIRMFFPQVGMPNRKNVTSEIQKVYPGAQVLQYKISTLQPGMPLIQVINLKSKNYLLNNGNIGEEVIDETAAWTKKEGKNPEGGLNKKGIASYRKEHPGSHLSLAVTTPPSELDPDSKSAKRRKSFCARMGGNPGPMKDEKGRPTRKALSLRKWNC